MKLLDLIAEGLLLGAFLAIVVVAVVVILR